MDLYEINKFRIFWPSLSMMFKMDYCREQIKPVVRGKEKINDKS